MSEIPFYFRVALVGTLVTLDSVDRTNAFFMGTKHTTPHTILPMHNDNGKTYAKVGSQYVEYNDDEMYYDRHQTMKNEAQLAKEDKDFFTRGVDDPSMISNSETRKEERHRAEQAWHQAKREEVDDVTGLPMYEGETYNQYGRMDYGKEPETYGGKQLGGTEYDYGPHDGPPLNPYYGGPHHQYGGPQHQYGGGKETMHRDVELPDMLAGRPDPKMFGNPWGHAMGYGGPPHDVRPVVDQDYQNYLRNPPRGIYTVFPLDISAERTTKHMEERMVANETAPQEITPHETTPTPFRGHRDDIPTGLFPNISAASFEKYHGADGNLNLANYARNRRIIELNERRASYAMDLARRMEHPNFDNWTPDVSLTPQRFTTEKTTPTTEFIPRRDVTIAEYICNF